MLPRCPSFKNTSQSFRSALIVFTRLIIRLGGRQMKKNSSMQRHAAYGKAPCRQSHPKSSPPIASSSSTTQRKFQAIPSTPAKRNVTHKCSYRRLQEARKEAAESHQYFSTRQNRLALAFLDVAEGPLFGCLLGGFCANTARVLPRGSVPVS